MLCQRGRARLLPSRFARKRLGRSLALPKFWPHPHGPSHSTIPPYSNHGCTQIFLKQSFFICVHRCSSVVATLDKPNIPILRDPTELANSAIRTRPRPLNRPRHLTVTKKARDFTSLAFLTLP